MVVVMATTDSTLVQVLLTLEVVQVEVVTTSSTGAGYNGLEV